jgi:hypothetical protein
MADRYLILGPLIGLHLHGNGQGEILSGAPALKNRLYDLISILRC